MDEDLYDEFGNYIGPEIQEEASASSESEDDARGQDEEVRGREIDAMDVDEGAPSSLWRRAFLSHCCILAPSPRPRPALLIPTMIFYSEISFIR